jgi:hypothetical protein
MTHLPYIAASYAIALIVVGWFTLDAWTRMGRAKHRLATLDRRTQR